MYKDIDSPGDDKQTAYYDLVLTKDSPLNLWDICFSLNETRIPKYVCTLWFQAILNHSNIMCQQQ